MSYHSRYNGYELETLLGCGLYSFKQNHKLSRAGPAPAMEKTAVDEATGETYEPEDIIDEALYYYKTNMFLRTFRIKGSGDRLILYLTHYCHQLIKRLVGVPNLDKAKAVVLAMQSDYNVLPTEPSFPFAAFFNRSSGGAADGGANSEATIEKFCQYSKQIRFEIGMRLIEKIWAFPEPDGTGNKHWLIFAKHQLLTHKERK